MWLRDRWKYICCRDCVKRRVDNEVSCFDAFSGYGDAGAYDKHYRRAVQQKKIDIDAVNIRDYTQDKHGRVDDYPYGGGAGMLMQAQPVYDACQSVMEKIPQNKKKRVIYVTPQGIPLHRQKHGNWRHRMSCFCYAGITRALMSACLRKWSQITFPSVIMY